jgi:hypothetical protein
MSLTKFSSERRVAKVTVRSISSISKRILNFNFNLVRKDQ